MTLIIVTVVTETVSLKLHFDEKTKTKSRTLKDFSLRTSGRTVNVSL